MSGGDYASRLAPQYRGGIRRHLLVRKRWQSTIDHLMQVDTTKKKKGYVFPDERYVPDGWFPPLSDTNTEWNQEEKDGAKTLKFFLEDAYMFSLNGLVFTMEVCLDHAVCEKPQWNEYTSVPKDMKPKIALVVSAGMT
jgi:hypothetical protein